MSSARAVVIPFGVPAERARARARTRRARSRLHADRRAERRPGALPCEGPGGTVHPLRRGPSLDGPVGPVEAFVPPQAWNDLAGAGNAPPDVVVVVTGAFEPPSDGRGMIQLLAFDAHDGSTRAKVEPPSTARARARTSSRRFDELWSASAASAAAGPRHRRSRLGRARERPSSGAVRPSRSARATGRTIASRRCCTSGARWGRAGGDGSRPGGSPRSPSRRRWPRAANAKLADAALRALDRAAESTRRRGSSSSRPRGAPCPDGGRVARRDMRRRRGRDGAGSPPRLRDPLRGSSWPR